jgi:hypothetical protein
MDYSLFRRFETTAATDGTLQLHERQARSDRRWRSAVLSDPTTCQNGNFSTYLTGALSKSVSNEFRFSYGRTRLRFEELRDDFLTPLSDYVSQQYLRS